jgi:phosphoglucosamine mutase
LGKLFGTDGIRGIVNETLDAPLAYRVGQAAALVLAEQSNGRPLFLIGKDTRISSDLLEDALTAGLLACGADVMSLGVIPTPAVAYLTVANHAAAGVVISASHNPFAYNGIKIFSGAGFKLNDDLEERVEALILSAGPLPVKTGAELGRVRSGAGQVERYLDHLVSTVPSGLKGLRILVDCANGAASATAPKLFSRFDLTVDYLHNDPDGVNINDHCGSTHLEDLCQSVVRGGYDLGIAFDGDADRCLAVDGQGQEVDGDKIMAICASRMQQTGTLQNNGFVATVMSNMGLHKYAASHGVQVLCAAVGDRNVLELMQKEHMVLGGEQSGHIIFLEHMTTGDGQLAALQLLRILCTEPRPLHELCAEIPRYPQVLINVPGPVSNADKAALIESPAMQKAIADGESQLKGDGRILVRPSGTEALIRVMVESSDADLAQSVANDMAIFVETIQKREKI